MVTALDEKDEICGNCLRYDKSWERCLVTGDRKYSDNTCDNWLSENTCKSCLIDFKKRR